MEPVSLDPRGIRTRAALLKALQEMVADVPPSEISVSALCRTARLHRTTFYKHYENVDQFVMSVIAGEIDAALDGPYKDPDSKLTAAEKHVESSRRGFEETFKNRQLFSKLVGVEGDGLLRRAVENRLAERFIGIAKEAEAVSKLPADPEYCGHLLAALAIAALEMELVRGETNVDAATARWLEAQPEWFKRYIRHERKI